MFLFFLIHIFLINLQSVGFGLWPQNKSTEIVKLDYYSAKRLPLVTNNVRRTFKNVCRYLTSYTNKFIFYPIKSLISTRSRLLLHITSESMFMLFQHVQIMFSKLERNQRLENLPNYHADKFSKNTILWLYSCCVCFFFFLQSVWLHQVKHSTRFHSSNKSTRFKYVIFDKNWVKFTSNTDKFDMILVKFQGKSGK